MGTTGRAGLSGEILPACPTFDLACNGEVLTFGTTPAGTFAVPRGSPYIHSSKLARSTNEDVATHRGLAFELGISRAGSHWPDAIGPGALSSKKPQSGPSTLAASSAAAAAAARARQWSFTRERANREDANSPAAAAPRATADAPATPLDTVRTSLLSIAPAKKPRSRAPIRNGTMPVLLFH